MSITTCPQCHHRFAAEPVAVEHQPDPGVVGWFAEAAPGWTGEVHVTTAYSAYLRACGAAPVARARFVSDLQTLGAPADADGYLLFP